MTGEQQIRLACLEQAVRYLKDGASTSSTVVRTADKFQRYVERGEVQR